MYSDPRLDELFVTFVSERARLEAEVCMVVLNDPAAGVSAGRELGLDADLFDVRPDLRLVYLACVVAGAEGRGAVLRLAMRAMKEECEAGRWTDANLAAFAMHFSPFPAPGVQATTLRLLVPRLQELHRRQRDAGEYIRQAARLLEGRAA